MPTYILIGKPVLSAYHFSTATTKFDKCGATVDRNGTASKNSE